jgi:uncharacterized protein YjbI with pentapeptide repeats
VASQEHLEILSRGVGAWNDWRAGNPSVRPILTGASLHGSDLNGANLDGADLDSVDVTDSRAAGATFIETNLMGPI